MFTSEIPAYQPPGNSLTTCNAAPTAKKHKWILGAPTYFHKMNFWVCASVLYEKEMMEKEKKRERAGAEVCLSDLKLVSGLFGFHLKLLVMGSKFCGCERGISEFPPPQKSMMG